MHQCTLALTNKLLTLLLPVSLVLGGCVVYPKTTDNLNSKCELTTKALSLETTKVDKKSLSGVNSPQAMVAVLAGSAVVGTASAIVSGSVYIAGNTVHWIEKSGRCEDGMIKKAVSRFGDSMRATGGWLVHSASQIINWLPGN